MQATSTKPKYLGCFFLEAGIHNVAISHFIGLAMALLAFGYEDILWTKLFPIIYLIDIICFLMLAWKSDVIFMSIGVMVLYYISTIAELIFGFLTVREYAKNVNWNSEL